MFRRVVSHLCKSNTTAAGAAASAAAGQQTSTAAPGESASPEQPPPEIEDWTKKPKKFRTFGGGAEQDRHEESGKAFFSGFASVSIISLGCSFIFVPLYKLYCQPTGRGFDPKFLSTKSREQQEEDAIAHPIRRKLLKCRFLSDVGNTMPIAFVPLQRRMDVLIGEPALAFYSAYNKSDRTLLGVSSYTISPPEAMAYLNKIQCFCFEEQRFKPHELVEMPVFFYIDKDFLNDSLISWLDEVIINYTFFNLERTREYIKKS